MGLRGTYVAFGNWVAIAVQEGGQAFGHDSICDLRSVTTQPSAIFILQYPIAFERLEELGADANVIRVVHPQSFLEEQDIRANFVGAVQSIG